MKKNFKVLVGYGKVIGYSDNKKIVRALIREHDLKDCVINVISEIPEDIEYEFSQKELFHDDYYDCITSEHLLSSIAVMVDFWSHNLLELEESLRDCLEYLRLEDHEKNMLFETQQHVLSICEDTIGTDADCPEGYYDDYYNIQDIISIYIKETV